MDSGERLRFVDADRLDTPAGTLAGALLVGPADETLGTLDGAVIDPIERHVRYYMLRSRRWFGGRRYLIPATPAWLDATRNALHVDLEPHEVAGLLECSRDSFPAYSDDDLLSAMFSGASR